MIQVYTGNGKGKTTAALGLALRAAGAGFKVYVCQFLKKRSCSELYSLKKINNIRLEQFGRSGFVRSGIREKDIELARAGFRAARRAVKSRRYLLVVLDEINLALKLNLISLKDVISLLKNTPKTVEIVLTGRNAHPAILKIADLVSEVKEKKHYFKNGLKARKGIEF